MDDAKTAIAGASSIVVQVNNLCPADGNILCSQSDLSGKSVNQYSAPPLLFHAPLLPIHHRPH